MKLIISALKYYPPLNSTHTIPRPEINSSRGFNYCVSLIREALALILKDTNEVYDLIIVGTFSIFHSIL